MWPLLETRDGREGAVINYNCVSHCPRPAFHPQKSIESLIQSL